MAAIYSCFCILFFNYFQFLTTRLNIATTMMGLLDQCTSAQSWACNLLASRTKNCPGVSSTSHRINLTDCCLSPNPSNSSHKQTIQQMELDTDGRCYAPLKDFKRKQGNSLAVSVVMWEANDISVTHAPSVIESRSIQWKCHNGGHFTT